MKPTIDCTGFRRYTKNSMVGFADVTISELKLTIRNITLHRRGESRWVSPGCPVYDPAKLPKIEILADGQVIAFGIHPETRLRYTWPRGEPGKIPRRGSALRRETDMVAFLDAAETLLVERFGWKMGRRRPRRTGHRCSTTSCSAASCTTPSSRWQRRWSPRTRTKAPSSTRSAV